MGSEVIVLSSDDEDDEWLGVKFKCSKIPRLDADVTVIDKMPSIEAKTSEKSNIDCFKLAQEKSAQDDDCHILSCDPDNKVHVPNFQATDADDLVIVGERGPVACRDFPHARHLCVKFPYATTPHEKHCEQCHCYVCDVVAPCLQWCQGRQSSDHCHAFDKDDKWRKLRIQAQFRPPKLSSRPRVTVQGEQTRTYTQPPLRVTLTTGLKGCTYPATSNLTPLNQGTPSFSGTSLNWQPYFPSSQSTMPVSSSFGNGVVVSETNSGSAGNLYSSLYPTVSRERVFTEHRSAVVNVATATVTSPASQPGSHQQCSIPSHQPLTNTQAGTHRQAIQSSSILVRQRAAHFSNSVNSPMQHYQDQRTGSFSAVPYNYAPNSCASTERISVRPSAAPVSSFNNDLTTLQSYLMEGISGQPLSQSTMVNESNTGRLQFSSDCMLQGQCATAHNGVVQHLHNPFEPLEAGAKAPAAPTANTQQVDKDDRNAPFEGASKKNAEHALNTTGETDNSSLLDHILAGFDYDLWTLLEPTYPGF
ncbi:hypothetical protein L7F22_012706 [Adiantum nelumboides]|nr:hypothetical protein [Adiantum nelumboides]